MTDAEACRLLIGFAKRNPEQFKVEVPKNTYGFAADERRVGAKFTVEMFDSGWNYVIRAPEVSAYLKEFDGSVTFQVGDSEALMALYTATVGLSKSTD